MASRSTGTGTPRPATPKFCSWSDCDLHARVLISSVLISDSVSPFCLLGGFISWDPNEGWNEEESEMGVNIVDKGGVVGRDAVKGSSGREKMDRGRGRGRAG